jgi:diguanylate cyclase (GGDEF)-like protein
MAMGVAQLWHKFISFCPWASSYDRFDPATEQCYRDYKFEDTKPIALSISLAAPFLASGLWLWDWAHDPAHIMQALPTRILMGVILSLYPLGMVAGVRRSLLPWLFSVLALCVEALYLYHLTLLERGMIYGIAGFMYWFILPVFMGLPYNLTVSLVLNPAIAMLPNILVPLGLAPQFELLKYNALIWPTCIIAIFVNLLLDKLYRRLFRYHQRIEALACNDALTSIANRRHFMETAPALIELCRRHKHPISIVMIDIDHFKRVNDEYGHPEGDKVIRMVADVIRTKLRSTSLLARYGGEEFAVVLPETGPNNAFFVAERIRRSLEEQRVVLETNRSVQVTISAGVAGYGVLPAKTGLEELIRQADAELYEAKRQGRNRVVLASVGMQVEQQ